MAKSPSPARSIHEKAPASTGTVYGAVKNKTVRTGRKIDMLSTVGGVGHLAFGAATGNLAQMAFGGAILATVGKSKAGIAKQAKTTAVENLIRRGKTGNTLGAPSIYKDTWTDKNGKVYHRKDTSGRTGG